MKQIVGDHEVPVAEYESSSKCCHRPVTSFTKPISGLKPHLLLCRIKATHCSWTSPPSRGCRKAKCRRATEPSASWSLPGQAFPSSSLWLSSHRSASSWLPLSSPSTSDFEIKGELLFMPFCCALKCHFIVLEISYVIYSIKLIIHLGDRVVTSAGKFVALQVWERASQSGVQVLDVVIVPFSCRVDGSHIHLVHYTDVALAAISVLQS